MSTLTSSPRPGGAPANFLDAGGGSTPRGIKQAVDLILANTAVKASCSTSSAGSPAATKSQKA